MRGLGLISRGNRTSVLAAFVVGVLALSGCSPEIMPESEDAVSEPASTSTSAAELPAPSALSAESDAIDPARSERVLRVIAAINSKDAAAFFAEFTSEVNLVTDRPREFRTWALNYLLSYPDVLTLEGMRANGDKISVFASYDSARFGKVWFTYWQFGFDSATGLINFVSVSPASG